jgi:hypothetical protein
MSLPKFILSVDGKYLIHAEPPFFIADLTGLYPDVTVKNYRWLCVSPRQSELEKLLVEVAAYITDM